MLELFDEILRRTLCEVLNTNISNDQWTQAVLPVAKGGIGIRRACDLALPACLSSMYGADELVENILQSSADLTLTPFTSLSTVKPCILDSDTEVAVGLWKLKSEQDVPPESLKAVQRAWDTPLIDRIFNYLLQGAVDQKACARLLAASTKESGAWLHALPAASLGLLMDNNCTRISVGLRLGIPLCEPHTCDCGQLVDKFGHHGLACRQYRGRKSRHDNLDAIINQALVSAGVPCILEPPGICLEDGKRPDSMSLVPWSRGRTLIWDVTCVDSYPSSNISRAQTPGGAAEYAEFRKVEKYNALSIDHAFVPLGFETFGTLGPSTRSFIKTLGQKVRSSTADRRAASFLKQRLSVAIQRGNSVCILATLPRGGGFDEFFYLT
ncbi:Uncharacterised protein r2_g2239 [Pycnogonum litorale]